MSEHDTLTRVACVQFEPRISEKEENLGKMLSLINEASSHNARLVVFPECSLQGYIFESYAEARECSDLIPGHATDLIAESAREHKIYVVFGMIERDGRDIYNGAVLLGPHGERGVVGKYRKMHPWWPLEHQWVTQGNLGYNVFSTDIGNIGMIICYDVFFPESARCLAIKGADIICHPSNWIEEEGIDAPKCLAKSRAIENHVFLMECDRIGIERGTRWAGISQIIDPFGKIISKSSRGREGIIYADIDVNSARDKRLVKGDVRSDLWRARRPRTYRGIYGGTYRGIDPITDGLCGFNNLERNLLLSIRSSNEGTCWTRFSG